ncbi:hypothetical protein AB0H77_03745 [Streptomyces sp. NPDC050844]|uniref:hypothetical protein n=1 Tax=Streptomyces sp. NPDC050844 TaxID=3155790 RepID=UPI0033FEC69E
MAFPQTPLVVTIWILVDGQWMDITPDVYLRNKIQITWGRQDWASKANTTKCPLTLNNGRSRVNPAIVGRYSRRNPRSDLYKKIGRNTRLRIQVTTPAGVVTTAFDGFVSSWPVKWDVDAVPGAEEQDVWVSIQANGIRRRLEQGSKATPDAIRRHVGRGGALLYWPLIDGEDARHGSEVIQGAQPMRAVGEAGSFYQGQPDWGKGALAPWLEPVVELPVETNGRITAYVASRTLTGWSVDHVVNSPGPGNVTQLNVFDDGPQSGTVPQVQWDILEWGSGGFNEVQLRITERLESSSSTALLTTVSNPGIYDGGVHHLRLSVASDGGSGLTWALYIDGVSVASGTRATGFRSVGRIVGRWALVSGGGIAGSAVALGHITYWGATPPTAAATWKAVQGHARELAGRRIERLCAEQGVPLAVTGNLDQTPAMGPQKPGTFLELIDSAAEVDGGTVHESRGTAGFAYRTRASKYNQGV